MMIFLSHQVVCNVNQIWCNETASKLNIKSGPMTNETQSGKLISKINRPFGTTGTNKTFF